MVKNYIDKKAISAPSLAGVGAGAELGKKWSTNVVASRPPERRPTATLTARANRYL